MPTDVLGELEAKVMNLVWSKFPMTVSEVTVRLSRERAYTTVQTTLERLRRKSLVERHKKGRAFEYMPRLDRAAFYRSMMEALLHGLSPSNRRAALMRLGEHLIAAARREDLDRLEQAIVARRVRGRRRAKEKWRGAPRTSR